MCNSRPKIDPLPGDHPRGTIREFDTATGHIDHGGHEVTIHPVPMDGTDGKVAKEPSRVRVSVVEPSGTWTFGLGKKCDLQPVGPATSYCEYLAEPAPPSTL